MNPLPFIILVEDDPQDEFFFKRVWLKAGCRGDVTTLKEGQELVAAFNHLANGGDPKPCLIILDSVVQPLSPEEICAAIVQLPSDIPMILLSGAQDSPLEHTACSMRMTSVIQKPITVERLQSILQTHCPQLLATPL